MFKKLRKSKQPESLANSTAPQQNNELPSVNYFATLGELAENYKGTTNVIFHRSNSIFRESGNRVEILVFGHLRDYKRLNLQMHEDGRLEAGVNFRNMWDDFAEGFATKGLPEQTFDAFIPLSEESTDETVHSEGVNTRRFRRDINGNILQIDLLRKDGSVILSDRRDVPTSSGKSKKSYVLCNESGSPVLEFKTITAYRDFWLDSVIGPDPAVLFSDSFGVANYTHKYKRQNVVVVQTFHNQHLRQGESKVYGYTEDRYLPFLKNIDDFDAVVCLTNRQKSDLDALMGEAEHRWVVPNSRSIETHSRSTLRSKTSGILVGSLIAVKQVDHAIQAVSDANKSLRLPTTLDIYGDGNLKPDLEELVRTLIVPEVVTFQGHQNNAAEKFSSASFSILSSRSEAMPLTLLESMARGCIPIAYDIKYGPADIITDGVDGFLVARDDIDGLAKAIVRIQNLTDEQLSKMRERTTRRAQDFSDQAVLSKWATVLSTAFSRKVPPYPINVQIESTIARLRRKVLSIQVRFSTDRAFPTSAVYLSILGRDTPVILREKGNLISTNEKTAEAQFNIPVEKICWVESGILDAYFDLYDAAGRATLRLKAPSVKKETYFGGFEMYATEFGNLSFRKQPSNH